MIFTRKKNVSYSSLPLSGIAILIKAEWQPSKNHPVYDYLEALLTLNNISDSYYLDSGISIVSGFLDRSKSWKSNLSYSIKKELNARIKAYNDTLKKQN